MRIEVNNTNFGETARHLETLGLGIGQQFCVPDGVAAEMAFERTRTMIVAAHQDDIEVMGFPLIRDAYATRSLGAVVLTNGAGSPRSGKFADFTDEQMQAARYAEQCRAAEIGHYSFLAQLGFPSAVLRAQQDSDPDTVLATLFSIARPEIILTHNLLDRHDTHIYTALRVIHALRLLPPEMRPQQLLGGEVWRGLDWLPECYKVRLDAGGEEELALDLISVFESQIAGGKRYDLATIGRRCANATFDQSHSVDDFEQVCFALDMTPLIADDSLDPANYITAIAETFQKELLIPQ